MKDNYSFQLNGKTLEVMFYGDIGDDYDGITARTFASELQPHNPSTILLRMNSIGGDAFDGAAIYNTLLRHKARVEIEIDGAALSAASLVAMAGDEIRIADNAMMMIHEPWGGQIGTAAEMRAQADRLEKMSGVYAETYANRSGNSIKEVLNMMASETWMNAEEAVAFGFADSSVGSRRMAAMAVPEGRFKNTPEAYLAAVKRPINLQTATVAEYRERFGEQFVADFREQIEGE